MIYTNIQKSLNMNSLLRKAARGYRADLKHTNREKKKIIFDW